MDDKVVIAVIAGTRREGRKSINAARWVAEQGQHVPGVEIIFVDPHDFNLPPDGAPEDGRDPKYSDITARADGFFIVTPEYNHGYPGSLKRLLDSEYDNYKHKAVAFAGVSDGQWGGRIVVDALLPVVRTLGLLPVSPTTYFPRVPDMFDDNGQMKPEYVEAQTKSVQGVYKDLIWLARALKAARAQS
jgi:NAD(P)H-dependent FMN reductase